MPNKLLVYVNQYFGDLVDARKATQAIIKEFYDEEILLTHAEMIVKPLKMGETYVSVYGAQRDVDDWDEREYTIEFPEVVEFHYAKTLRPKEVFEKLYRAMVRLTKNPKALKSTIPPFLADPKAMTALAETYEEPLEESLTDAGMVELTLDEDDDFRELITMSPDGSVSYSGGDFTIKRNTVEFNLKGDRNGLHLKVIQKLTLDLNLKEEDLDPDPMEPDYDDTRKERLEEPDWDARYANNLRHASIRIASKLPTGNETRRGLLAALQD